MTHDVLLGRVKYKIESCNRQSIDSTGWSALRAVVEYHAPYESKDYGLLCRGCDETPNYPCGTIRAIEKELG